VHAAFLAIFVLFIDRKLGGARDWDLFAAHGFGLVLLAVWALGARMESPRSPATAELRSAESRGAESRGAESQGAELRGAELQPPGPQSAGGRSSGLRDSKPQKPKPQKPKPSKARAGAGPRASAVPVLARAALPAAVLLSVPWVVLLHRESGSIERFTDVAAGFARFPRAYAYEELGKYYRKADDVDHALAMYELCAETYPANGRFHVLLGSMYVRKYAKVSDAEEKKTYLEKAEASYREGARLQENDPHAITLINLGRCLSMQGKWDEAVAALGQASQLEPSDPETWASLGHALLQTERLDDAIGSYENALRLNRRQAVRRELGAALLATSRYEEATEVFREGLRQGENRPVLEYGLAASLVAQADRARRQGEVPSLEGMAEAEQLLRAILQQNPGDADAQAVYERLRMIMGSG
jgi:tetratricopeptide (TPR) repeat protein